MFTLVRQWAESITQPCQLKVKVTVQGHGFEPWILCLLCISFTPGGFSLNFGQMFISVGQCAEPITQPSRLKVKVTVEGHEFEPWISCGFHISFTPGRIFFKRWSTVCLSEVICRTHQLCWFKVKVTIEGHQFEPWILRPLSCHSDCLVKFGSNVCLSEMVCRTYNSTMQTQCQGHNWKSSISFLFAPYLLNPLKDFHETLVKCLP